MRSILVDKATFQKTGTKRKKEQDKKTTTMLLNQSAQKTEGKKERERERERERESYALPPSGLQTGRDHYHLFR